MKIKRCQIIIVKWIKNQYHGSGVVLKIFKPLNNDLLVNKSSTAFILEKLWNSKKFADKTSVVKLNQVYSYEVLQNHPVYAYIWRVPEL